MNLCIIPARGGSKRIPKKNIKLFLGKPIIAYSIETALKSNLFDDVIVSTDSEKIAEIAEHYGATIPFMRPDELSDDFTGTTEVIRHAAKTYAELKNCQLSAVCGIYSTAPFVQTNSLIKSHQQLMSLEQGMVYSFTSFAFPIQRAQKIDKQGHPSPFQPECMPMRSQDLEDAFHDAGQFYWWTYQSLTLGVKEVKAQILPRHLVQDIDTEEDWRRAELMYQILQKTDFK